MDRNKFEGMLPALLAHYPTVRSRDHYKAPPRRPASGVVGGGGPSVGGGLALAEGVGWQKDFQGALEVFLGKSLGQNDAVRVQRSFVRVYQDHIAGLNLEEVERVAQAAREHQ